MSELNNDLQGYLDHCMNTGQEQVADLVGQAISEISRQHAVIARFGDEKKFVNEDYEFWWEDECKARIQYAQDNMSKSDE